MFFSLPLIAIDIGSSSIKIAELTGRQNKKKLRTVGVEIIPATNVADGFIEDITAVESSLRDVLKKLKIKTRNRRASISLNGSSVIIKKVSFPKQSNPAELADSIFYEAEQHFQHNIQDLYFDYYQYPVNPQDNEVPILLVGAKKDVVDQHISLIKSVGLSIGSVECGILSLANMFEYNYGQIPGLVAIVNVGFHSTQVILLGNGQYLYTRDIGIGGMGYTKNIAARMGIGLDVAEQLKIAASQPEDSSKRADVKSSIQEINDQLVGEIQLTLEYFFQNKESVSDFNHVDGVYLCGGGALVLDLDSSLSANLRTPVSLINPFHKVEIPRNFPMDQLLEQRSLYGTGIGLALRALNDAGGP
jgi:type IV pilus assembly protein PilM